MSDNRVTLWRLTWSHGRGAYWMAMRLCDPDNAQAWMDIFRKDDAQGVVYVASKQRPKLPSNARELARHPAVYH